MKWILLLVSLGAAFAATHASAQLPAQPLEPEVTDEPPVAPAPEPTQAREKLRAPEPAPSPEPVQAPESAQTPASEPVRSVSPPPPAPPEATLPSDAPSDIGARAKLARATGPGEFELGGTGSRMNLPLRELPASVTTVDRRTLDERGVVDLNQALGLMAGVMPTWQYGGFQHVRVRGFQALMLIDGRRDPRALLADSAPQAGIYDLERVELLRGPASVLYGFGATGGVVNMIRRRPSSRREAQLELGLGLPNQLRAHAGAQGAMGPMLSSRVDLSHVSHENFRQARTRRSQVSAGLRFAPSRHHTANLRVSYANDRYDTDVGIPTIEDPKRPGTWILPPDARRSNGYGTRNDYLAYQRIEVSADYRADLSNSVYLEARGAIGHDRYAYLAAETLTYVPPMAGTNATVDREYLYFARGWKPGLGQLELHTNELRTGPVVHQLVLGYQLDHFRGLSDRGDVGDALPGSVDFVYPVDRAERVSGLQRTAKDHYRQITQGLYAFEHAKLLDQLILTGGVRLDAFRNRTRREFVDRISGDAIPDPNTGLTRRPNRQTNRAVTGQAGVVYTPVAPVTTYLGYASSFTPQIVYPSAVNPVRYRPERGQQLEGGVRLFGAHAGHAAEMHAAGYFIQKKNIVIPRGPDDFVQAGKVVSRGLDLSVNYRAPWLVELQGGYSLTAAEYRRFVSTDPVTGRNLSRRGNQVDFAPRHSGTAWLRFVPLAGIGAGVGTRFVGKQFADPENRMPMPAHTLVDASLWFGGAHATFMLSATNLLNEHDYITSVINTWAPNPQVTPGPGREVLGVLRLVL